MNDLEEIERIKKIERIEKNAKKTIFTIIVFVALKMTYEVYDIPDYRNNEADFQYSEDKQYKGILVSPLRDTSSVAILVRTSDNEILAYSQLTRDSEVSSLWFNYCYEDGRFNQMCFEPATFMEPISLPPSLWKRVNAWLIVKIRGFEVPALPEKEWSRYYHYSE